MKKIFGAILAGVMLTSMTACAGVEEASASTQEVSALSEKQKTVVD